MPNSGHSTLQPRTPGPEQSSGFNLLSNWHDKGMPGEDLLFLFQHEFSHRFFFFLFEYFEHSMGYCYLVANSCPTLRIHKLQHTRLLYPSLSPGVCSNLMLCPLSWWCHPTILSSTTCPSPPALNLSRYQDLLQWVGFSHRVAKVLELQLQPQSF